MFTQALAACGIQYESRTTKRAAGPRIELYAHDILGRRWLFAVINFAGCSIAAYNNEKVLFTLAQSALFSFERIVALVVEKEGKPPSL